MSYADKNVQLLPPSPATEIAKPAPLTPLSGTSPARPRVAGKFIFMGEEKFYASGVSHGPFQPEADGSEYRDQHTVARDFALMAANNVNRVRPYTMPPRWLLDLALK